MGSMPRPGMLHSEPTGHGLWARSCLENPRDGGAWWAAVFRVAQSQTRLKRLSSSSSSGLAGKESACSAGDPGSIPGKTELERGKATHSSILAWAIWFCLAL